MTAFGEKPVLVLQGGGALGAYQAGAYEALCDTGYMPTWVAGISIGALNAAIIAGNPPDRASRACAHSGSGSPAALLAWPLGTDDNSRRDIQLRPAPRSLPSAACPASSSRAFLLAVFMPQGTPEAISVYDTHPLHATLMELVDFDLLNSGAVRLSVGAVQVLTGNMKYFDTAKQSVGPEHVMASGALPPGFPPIEIDGEPYWDGGLVSNTPLEYVLERSGPRQDMCIFQIDLFSAKGCHAGNLFDIGAAGEGDPLFEPHPAQHRYLPRDADHPPGHSALADEGPGKSSTTMPIGKFSISVSCDAAITIVLLIHRRAAYWTQSSDYEFSRYSMDEHWLAGRADVEHTLNHPAWKNRTRPEEGVRVLDLTRDLDTDPRERRL